jgi:hypothetical protein
MDGGALGLILFVHLMPETQRGIVCWQHSSRDILGNPEVIAEVEYALTVDEENANAGKKSILRRKRMPIGCDWRRKLRDHGVPVDTMRQLERHYRADIVRHDLLAPPLATGEYRIWVRVSDPSGNWSTWGRSKSSYLFVDTIPPEPPTEIEYLP